jgi:hypothetical protein
MASTICEERSALEIFGVQFLLLAYSASEFVLPRWARRRLLSVLLAIEQLNTSTLTLREPSMYLEMSWNSTIMLSAFSSMDLPKRRCSPTDPQQARRSGPAPWSPHYRWLSGAPPRHVWLPEEGGVIARHKAASSRGWILRPSSPPRCCSRWYDWLADASLEWHHSVHVGGDMHAGRHDDTFVACCKCKGNK